MFFEFRFYQTRPGKRDTWVTFMDDEIIPFQQSKGMVIVGNFVGEQDEHLYVWIRRFESEEERVAQYKAVYETDHWKNTVSPQVAELIDREKIEVVRLAPTSRSILR